MATVFSVRAQAGKKGFSISLLSESPLVLRADIPSEPVKGRANAALLSELESRLSCKVEILSGQTGRKKTLAADCDATRIVSMAKAEGE